MLNAEKKVTPRKLGAMNACMQTQIQVCMQDDIRMVSLFLLRHPCAAVTDHDDNSGDDQLSDTE